MKANIFGKMQSGKTTLAYMIVAEWIKKDLRERFIIVDNERDQYDKNLKRLGFEEVTLSPEKPGEIAWEQVLLEESRLFVNLDRMDDNLLSRHIDELAYAVQRLGNAMFVIDEAWNIWATNEKQTELERLVRSGEKRGIERIFISQQPVDIAMPLRSQSDLVVSFKITNDRHIEKIHKFMGGEEKFEEKKREYEEKKGLEHDTEKDLLEILENYEYYEFDPDNQVLNGPKKTKEFVEGLQ